MTGLKGVIDEKAKNANKVQEENKTEFTSIRNKIEKNNENFYGRIGELEKHKSAVDTDLSWIKPRVK